MKKKNKWSFLWLVLKEDAQRSILLLTEGRGSICLTIDSFKPTAYFYISDRMTPDCEPEKLTQHRGAWKNLNGPNVNVSFFS